MKKNQQLIVYVAVLFAVIETATAIECYICNATDSASPFQCGEWFERYDKPDIQPKSCEGVHGARYCVKHIGRFEANAIKCYQCSSAETIDCSDVMINQPDAALEPTECDSVHKAEYCIKSTALNGGIGAKRFCSSKDLGNYCNYVQNKGDRMEYRSCIFTCSTDGCNHSTSISVNQFTVLMLATTSVLFSAIAYLK